jgi:hypothetical protein
MREIKVEAFQRSQLALQLVPRCHNAKSTLSWYHITFSSNFSYIFQVPYIFFWFEVPTFPLLVVKCLPRYMSITPYLFGL